MRQAHWQNSHLDQRRFLLAHGCSIETGRLMIPNFPKHRRRVLQTRSKSDGRTRDTTCARPVEAFRDRSHRVGMAEIHEGDEPIRNLSRSADSDSEVSAGRNPTRRSCSVVVAASCTDRRARSNFHTRIRSTRRLAAASRAAATRDRLGDR